MVNHAVKVDFAIHEVVVLTGFSKYMLDYLAREDIFVASVPRRRGLRRKYSYTDVVLLKALHVICTGRGKVKFLKEALRKFRDGFGPLQPGDKVDKKLFLLGDELHAFDAEEGGRALQSGQLTLSFIVDLPKIREEMDLHVLPGPVAGSFRLSDAANDAARQVREDFWKPIRQRRGLAP